MHLSASSVLMIALAFIARGYFNVLCSSILLFLHLFNVLVTYDNFPWASIKLSFYITATMISLLTSILITARHDGFLTIAAVCNPSRRKMNRERIIISIFCSFWDTSPCLGMGGMRGSFFGNWRMRNNMQFGPKIDNVRQSNVERNKIDIFFTEIPDQIKCSNRRFGNMVDPG